LQFYVELARLKKSTGYLEKCQINLDI
jgi:hypothetical protein